MASDLAVLPGLERNKEIIGRSNGHPVISELRHQMLEKQLSVAGYVLVVAASACLVWFDVDLKVNCNLNPNYNL